MKNFSNNGAGETLPRPLQDAIGIELDTGRTVSLVIAELSMLYELGEIPDELTPLAARELFAPAKDDERERGQRYLERLRLARWVVGKVLRTPGLGVEELYHDEIWEIYSLANSPARALETFRRQQARRVDSVSKVPEIQPNAQPELARA
jgi:hypothetical protein